MYLVIDMGVSYRLGSGGAGGRRLLHLVFGSVDSGGLGGGSLDRTVGDVPAMPIKPPLKNPAIPEESDLPAVLPAAEPARPAPPPCLPPTTIVTARMAIMASDSREPPVRPTLTPNVAIKLSIF